jgi:hypothetical protein
MRSLICFALKEEAAPFRKIAAGKQSRTAGLLNDSTVILHSAAATKKRGPAKPSLAA